MGLANTGGSSLPSCCSSVKSLPALQVKIYNQMPWFLSAIPAFQRLREEDQEFKANRGYIESLRLLGIFETVSVDGSVYTKLISYCFNLKFFSFAHT